MQLFAFWSDFYIVEEFFYFWNMFDYDLIVIWAGSAGLPAAMYASRYKLKNLVIGEMPWGALATSHNVENWPWVLSESGGNIMNSFLLQAKASGSEILQEKVEKIEKTGERAFALTTSGGKRFTSPFVLFATGNSYRHLWVPGENEFLWRGVSYCATCDGNFFRNQVVTVVGWWNTAITEALYLAEIASHVHILVRSHTVRAEAVWMDKIHAQPNITLHYETEVEEIRGDAMGVKNLLLTNKTEITTDGIFIAVGTSPNTSLLDHMFVDKDDDGTICVDRRQETSIQGLFAAGDVTNGSNKFRQTIMSAAEWCLAANSIHEDFLRFVH